MSNGFSRSSSPLDPKFEDQPIGVGCPVLHVYPQPLDALIAS